MQTFTKIFNCKYPIACMAMNQVSDVPLAIAVRNAGCLPSLSIFNYYVKSGAFDTALFEQALKQYQDAVGDTSILISTDITVLVNLPLIVDLLLTYRVKAVEIILEYRAGSDPRHRAALPEVIARLRSNGTLVFTKTLFLGDTMPGIDGIVLKGPDGAGRGNTTGETLGQLFDQFKSISPSQRIITSGGVGTSAQLKYYIDRGAFGVGIGTMFAVSAESKISTETKLKLVAASAANVTQLNNGKSITHGQNAVVFSSTSNDNQNNTRGLMAGIRTPNQGHVFIGKGIEHATEILTCEEIVKRLAADLQH
jgi:NAD(P)H-dependent flavin oxidoreductase YrpB (nitropropane dioxygenase family)